MISKKIKEYFEKTAGILKTKGKLTQALLNERKKDKEKEDKKRRD